MRLALDELLVNHPALRAHPTNYSRFGAIALQRAGHVPPTPVHTDEEGVQGSLKIHWSREPGHLLDTLDSNRITEEGAEALALAFVHLRGGWTAKRRLQRGEHADWLLVADDRWLALEVSGVAAGDCRGRLSEKRSQVAACTLPVAKLAVVVGFEAPSMSSARP